jgi:hypothetical protein
VTTQEDKEMITEKQAIDWSIKIRDADWNYHYIDDYVSWNRGREECLSVYNDAKIAKLTDDDIQLVVDVFLSARQTNTEEYVQTQTQFITDIFTRSR